MAAKARFVDGTWWVFVHHAGKRWKKRVGSDKRMAEDLAKRMQARLVLGELTEKPKGDAPVPFAEFADRWLRLEVELPIERGLDGHLAPGSSDVYRMQVRVHLRPFFREREREQELRRRSDGLKRTPGAPCPNRGARPSGRIRCKVSRLHPLDRPEVADHALYRAAALLEELRDVDRHR